MSGALVLDASAAVTLFREERATTEVRRHLGAHARGGQPILVPTLFWLEIINVLARRHRFPPEAIVEAIYELEQLGATTVESGRPTALAVVDAVARFGLTAYDAAYLVLAESADAALLTADASLAAAAGQRAILVGTGGAVGEARTTYESGRRWTAWEGAASYLAALRSEISGTR